MLLALMIHAICFKNSMLFVSNHHDSQIRYSDIQVLIHQCLVLSTAGSSRADWERKTFGVALGDEILRTRVDQHLARRCASGTRPESWQVVAKVVRLAA